MARCVLLLGVLVALTLCQSSPVSAWQYLEKITVFVTNNLEGGKILTVHCKSKDGDLGVHALSVEDTFQWTFSNNFSHTPLFWCDMEWKRSPGGELVKGSFNIYRSDRDLDRCSDQCLWYVKEDALYSGNAEGVLEPIYSWPK
ncbi:hypothetical protein HHK36_006019 [Tetracentron sinense]|nr:hypothetical protein HHK36_006019 [Tetracentron sinense]